MLYACSVIFCIFIFSALSKYIKKYAVLFYLLTLCSIGFLYTIVLMNVQQSWPQWITGSLMKGYTNGIFSVAILSIVMYLGALNSPFQMVKNLKSVRGEMAIIGAIMAFGHSVFSKNFLLTRIMAEKTTHNLQYVITMADVHILLLILLPLFITSFKNIRKRIKPRQWKNIQKSAYAFYALLYAHVMVILSFNMEGTEVMINMVAYSIVFISYAILRIQKYWRERKRRLPNRTAIVN